MQVYLQVSAEFVCFSHFIASLRVVNIIFNGHKNKQIVYNTMYYIV